jgi:GH43 family beta-xylosidase
VQELPGQTFMLHQDIDGAPLARSMGHTSHGGTVPLEGRFRRSLPPGTTFKNPILPAPAADPWIILHEGVYYSCESRHQDSIWIRSAECFTDLGENPGTMVWSAPAVGGNSKSVWAPELHLIDGKWYIYYAADDGLNENHRMWVLEGLTDNPAGPYTCRGALETSGWAIDGTFLKTNNGSLYYIWSGWPGNVNGQQNLYIAPMTNPWSLAAERTVIAKPEHSWECVDMAICEGPQILQRDGRTFLVYSASGSWTEDYCLGLMELTGKDPLQPAHWTKHGPAFCKTDYVWGIGHCSFVQSQDGTEDWIIYHAKTKRKKGWNDRNVRAQRFTWSKDGLPNFGMPTPVGRSIPVPSGARSAPVGL